ncbi:MAG TPA: hypothetical protein VN253_24880 [Kofleriaceae bacterium]|nr:hypothetical protein [Kofleriaceae bacterium]
MGGTDADAERDLDPWDFGLWKRFELWAGELGRSWPVVLREAGVADPNTARASRARMRKGGAPEVRRALYNTLVEMERKRSSPTMMGKLMMGVEDWATLGRQLAALDPHKFVELLDSLRDLVDTARRSAAAMSAFKPKE